MHDKIPAGLTTQTRFAMPQTQLQFHPSSLCGRRIRREKRFYATLKNSRTSLFHFLPRFSVERNNPHLFQLAMPLCDFLILCFYPGCGEGGREGGCYFVIFQACEKLLSLLIFRFFFLECKKCYFVDFLIFEILLDYYLFFILWFYAFMLFFN